MEQITRLYHNKSQLGGKGKRLPGKALEKACTIEVMGEASLFLWRAKGNIGREMRLNGPVLASEIFRR